MKTGAYDSNFTVTIKDVPSIGMEVFRADQSNYTEEIRRLAARKVADSKYLLSLSSLIGELFQRRVIEQCAITYGTKLEFKLSRRGEGPQILGLDGALDRFVGNFEDITGQSIAVIWNDTGETTTSRSRGKRDYSGVGGFVSKILDALADGIAFAIAFDWLND